MLEDESELRDARVSHGPDTGQREMSGAAVGYEHLALPLPCRARGPYVQCGCV